MPSLKQIIWSVSGCYQRPNFECLIIANAQRSCLYFVNSSFPIPFTFSSLFPPSRAYLTTSFGSVVATPYTPIAASDHHQNQLAIFLTGC
mmetsp:Transcript_19676/g.29196  ORF Transcript_19676/g.29196 Transcript_19676/m.29196 type:complete len:90 (-) Transcript_19676:662-931(-)